MLDSFHLGELNIAAADKLAAFQRTLHAINQDLRELKRLLLFLSGISLLDTHANSVDEVHAEKLLNDIESQLSEKCQQSPATLANTNVGEGGTLRESEEPTRTISKIDEVMRASLRIPKALQAESGKTDTPKDDVVEIPQSVANSDFTAIDQSRLAGQTQKAGAVMAHVPLQTSGGKRNQEAVDATYTIASVLSLAQVSDSTWNKYAKLAGVKTPGRGKRNHLYSFEEVQKTLIYIRNSTSSRAMKEQAEKGLQEL